MALMYACSCVRLKHLSDAEGNLKNYRHSEPLRMEGKTKMVEIREGVSLLSKPLLIGMQGVTGSKEAHASINALLKRSTTWYSPQEAGIQIIASSGWVMDISKARPPDITKDTSSIDYTPTLLPSNLAVRDESAPSGYNQGQVAILEETRAVTRDVLQDVGDLHETYSTMGVVLFAQQVFRTHSRVLGCLPDPDDEERKRFDEAREQARINKEAAEAE
jgi:hypothetical protein